jgi:hypothetical protein
MKMSFLKTVALSVFALLLSPLFARGQLSFAVMGAHQSGNPVVRENQRRGTRDWLITKVQPVTAVTRDDPFQRRRAIEGYCARASVRVGETLDCYVSTAPASKYRAEVYRLGYYGGDGGRLVKAIGPFEGFAQTGPIEGPKQLMESRWKKGFEIKIPADWLSGVYLGKLTALDSGYQSYLIFIVRDDRRADFLFQCSDLTWQAYNRWPGWRSLYDWGDNKWHTRVGAEVSFDRPYGLYYNLLPSDFNPLSNGSGEFLLWEFPLAFWMEKEGYDVTYISNIDTHSDPDGLLRAKGFLSVGHDEYWTDQMFQNVVRARDSGVNIAFFSGNSVSGRIYLKPGTDGRPSRIFGRIDYFTEDKELMGAASHGVGAADWVCAKPDHWVFEGTDMKEGDAITRLVGWEYHGPPLRDDPRLVVLARGKVKVYANLTDKEYASTIYPGPRENFVFNAGTCWWSMVISRPPGYQNPSKVEFQTDPRVQRMTKNILDRMIRQKKD